MMRRLLQFIGWFVKWVSELLGCAVVVLSLVAVVCSLCGVNLRRCFDSRPMEKEYGMLDELRADELCTVFSEIEKEVPPMATNLHFEGMGELPLFGRGWHFRCQVSEADFRAFAAEKGYPLVTNVFRNANTEIVGDDRLPSEMDLSAISGWLFPSEDATPEIGSYLSYWFGYRNCGGLILVYDLDRQILYGSDSAN